MQGEELTQAELDEIFYGKAPKVDVLFYDEEVVDVEASRLAGHRVTKLQPHVHLKCVKERSETRRPAQDADKRKYAAQWAAYQEQKHESQSRHSTVDQAAKENANGIPEGYADDVAALYRVGERK